MQMVKSLDKRTKKSKMNEDSDINYTWSPERMLEMILSEEETLKNDWLTRGMPQLIDKLVTNYEKYEEIIHLDGKDLPSKRAVIGITEEFMTILFPGYHGKIDANKSHIKTFLGKTLKSIYEDLVEELNKSLKYICRRVKTCPEDVCLRRAQVVAKEVLVKIPEIRTLLRGDIQASYDGDPAAKSTDEVILSYPCVLAIATYRIAHEIYIRGVPLVPRIMSEYAHSITGIDIHPGAKIGKNFFIDHGTGVVIGETAEIGDNVKIYQGVTLGALSFPKDRRGQIIKGLKRHPTVGNNVVIYSGATILGGETKIGNNAIVGGNAWITSSIPSSTQVILAPTKLYYKDINSEKKQSEI